MKRRLSTILSALSLLLFVAVIVLWVRSYQVAEEITHFDGYGNMRGVASNCGGLYIKFGLRDKQMRSWWMFNEWYARPWERNLGIASRRWQGVRVYSDPGVFFEGTERVIIVSHWLLALTFAVAPTRWALAVFWRRRGGSAILCHSCGYDLRATPERCPECATLPPKG